MNEDDRRLSQFQQEYLTQQGADPIYECFVEAWLAYHRAANDVDGHLPLEDRDLNRLATVVGMAALKKYMDSVMLSIPCGLFGDDVTDWNRAKLEAVRRLELIRKEAHV